MSLYSSYKPQNVAGVSSVVAGTDTAVSTSSGAILIWNTSTLQTVTNRGSTTTNRISITNTATSTSTTTGALVVAGGVGIGGNLNVASTSYIDGSQILTTASISSYGVASITAGTDTAISSNIGNITIWNTGTLQTVTGRGSTTTNSISITNTTTSISTTTGALTVAGGVGIGGDVYIGGTEYIQKTNITASSDSVASWIYDSTSTYTSTVTNQDIFFKPDGTKMFGVSTNAVYQWTLSTPWTLTGTVTSGTTYSLASVDTGVTGITFSPDGTKMVTIGNTAVVNATFGVAASEDRAYYFTLATPWDPSTATLAGTIRFASGQQGYVGTSESTPTACAFDNTGSNFYMIGTTNRRVFQYTLSSPYTVTTATATYSTGTVLAEDTSPQGLNFNYTGTRMYVLGATNDSVSEYRLSTPWDVTTAVYYDKFFVGLQNGSMLGLYINSTATNSAFMVGSTAIYRYATNTQAIFVNPETTTSNIILNGLVRVKGATNILYTDYDIYAGRNITTYNNTINVGQSGAAASLFTGLSTGALSFYTGQSSGALSVGGGSATGNLTFGQSTAAQAVGIASGATTSGTTKTVNIGTNGTTGSITNINIGPILGTGTVTITTGSTVVVNGSLYAAALYDNNFRVLTTATLGNYVVTSITAGTDTAVSTSTGAVTIWNTSTLQTITSRGSTTTNRISITNNATSTSTTTGALVVTGGVGISGNLYVGGSSYVNDSLVITTATLGNYVVTSITAGTDTAVSTSTGAVTIWNTSTLQTITSRGSTTTNRISITNNATSTSTTTGALVVTGGVGIGGAVYAGELYDSGKRVLTTATSIVNSIIAGTDISVSSSTGNVTISDISTLQSVTNRGSTTTNIVYINNTSTSNATTSGALIVSGGIGIAGAINAGSTISALTQLSIKSDFFDTLNSSTILLSSSVPIGYSSFTIQNTGASGQSYTLDVGGSNRAFTGGTSINEGNFTLKDNTNDAYRLVVTKTGNMLINTTTDTGAQLQVNGSLEIKSSLLETTVTLVNNTSTTVVDSFVSTVYRSCKSLVQIQDGNDFEITEIVLLHDDIGQVYKSEYGIISTNGEKGNFTADLQGDGVVRLYFTANSSSSKKISIVKTALAI